MDELNTVVRDLIFEYVTRIRMLERKIADLEGQLAAQEPDSEVPTP